jgi:hypothetical protein
VTFRLTQKAWGLLRRLRLKGRGLHLGLSSRTVNFRLSGWYGRAGNNIQQLIVVIAHAEAFRGSVQLDGDLLATGQLGAIVRPFRLDFGDGGSSGATALLTGTFFHYMEFGFSRSNPRRMGFARGDAPRRDGLLGQRHIHRQAHRIARSHLLPHLRTPDRIRSRDEMEGTLVIHLRGGDVANLENRYYVTNPLHYYRELSHRHRRALIVTEPGSTHPLLAAVQSLFPVHDVVSGSVAGDFQLLRQAVHLATSGVGTFAVAAALLSERLRHFHCTDVFLIEHLNPRMLDTARVEVDMLRLPGFQEAWLRSRDRLGLLLHWRPRSRRGVPAGLRSAPGEADPP